MSVSILMGGIPGVVLGSLGQISNLLVKVITPLISDKFGSNVEAADFRFLDKRDCFRYIAYVEMSSAARYAT